MKKREPAIKQVRATMFGGKVTIRRSGGVSLARMKARVALRNRSGDGCSYTLVSVGRDAPPTERQRGQV